MDQTSSKNGWYKKDFLKESKLIMDSYIEGVHRIWILTYFIENFPVISIYNRDLFNDKKLYYGQVEYKTPKDQGDMTIYRTSKIFEGDLELLKFKCLVKANELGWNINLFSYKEG